jgi:Zn-finger nucleic acid-binding protein
MQCPIDKVDLVMTERSGIEVDYCPKCRGVWLDRGELDKIIERAGSAPAIQPEERRGGDQRYEQRGERYESRDKPYHKKRKSFLDDIFDF